MDGLGFYNFNTKAAENLAGYRCQGLSRNGGVDEELSKN